MKHKLTRLTALMLAFVMSFSMLLVPVNAADFTDVSENAWYAAAVDYAYEKGWMNGVSDTEFAPMKDVTRAMFVTVLARFADAELDDTVSAFTDTKAGKWYTGAAAWAAQNGVTVGVGENRFAPNKTITRQDFCTMLYRYIQKEGIEIPHDADVGYADRGSVAAYARDAVDFCYAAGLVSGFDDGTFRPKDTATRAQIAQILMRLDLAIQGKDFPTDPMPAQEFSGEAGEDMTVSVNAPEGALPEGSDMTVSRVTDEAVLNAIKEKAGGSEVLAAADITFRKDGNEIEPEEKVEVQIALDGIENVKNPMVVHLRADGNLEYVDAELVSVNRSGSEKALRFYAKDFSVYAFLDDTGDNTKVTITFYARTLKQAGATEHDYQWYKEHPSSTQEWEIINKQVIFKTQIQAVIAALDNEDPSDDDVKPLVYDPGLPDLKETQSFEGWTPKYNFTEEDKGKTVAAMNEALINDCRNNTLQETVDEYAMVYDVVYVIYHDQAGAVLRTDYKHANSLTNKASVTIEEDYVPFKGNQDFQGWVTKDKVETLGEVPTYKEITEEDIYKIDSPEPYEIDDTLELYPYVLKGYWLSFNNNFAANNAALGLVDDDARAEYIAPKFYAEGKAPGTAPTFQSETPRPGYRFVDWFADSAMTIPYDFTKPLTQDTTVYAKWEFSTAKYYVVFWRQRSDENNTPNTANANKTYDFYKIEERTATVGSPVSITTSNSGTTADNRRGGNSAGSVGEMGFFFQYNGTNSDTGSKILKGDGTTILNVKYDRKIITYKFYTSRTYQSARNLTNYNVNNQYFYYYSSSSIYPLWLTSTNANYPDENGNIPAAYARLEYISDYNYNTEQYVYSTLATSSSYLQVLSGSSPTTITGLYGARCTETPAVSSSYTWHCLQKDGSHHEELYDEVFEKYIIAGGCEDRTTVSYWRQSYSHSSSYKTINCIGQDEDGNWTVTLRTMRVYGPTDSGTGETAYFDGNEYLGYHLEKYNLGSNNYSTATPWSFNGTDYLTLNYTNDLKTQNYAYYARNKHNLVYYSNNEQANSVQVYYNKRLSGYASYVPTNGPTGYYFKGWYSEPSCQDGNEYNFNQTMPDGDLIIYAKWVPKWYRVVVDYKHGLPAGVTINLPGTTQKDSFTIQYDGKIQTEALLKARRIDPDGEENYKLLGLYFDEKCTEPFNENMLAPFGFTEENYPAGQRTGYYQTNGDTWSTSTQWSDENYPDVRAKITLYAKWRADPNGTIGYNLHYEGDQNDTDTGYFDYVNENPKPHELDDEKTYVDRAEAYAKPATTPDVEGEQFLYWEVLDAEGNPTGQKAYPGGTFEVRQEDASMIRERVPDPNCTHTNKTLVDAVDPTCTQPGHHAYYECTACHKKFETESSTEEYDPTVLAVGHRWGEWTVTTAPTCTVAGVETRECSVCHTTETRETELAAHTWGAWQPGSGDSHYHVCSVCGTRTGEPCSYPTVPNEHQDAQIGVAGYDKFICTVCGREKTVEIPALSAYSVIFHVPEGVGLTAPATVANVPTGEFSLAGYAPEGTLTVEGWEFAGWVSSELSATTNEVQPLDSVTVTNSDVHVYALFTHAEEETFYQRVNAAKTDWSGNYVISYGSDASYVLKGSSANETSMESTDYAKTLSAAGITRNDDKLYNVSNDYVFLAAELWPDDYAGYYIFLNLSTYGYPVLAGSGDNDTIYNIVYNSGDSIYYVGVWKPTFGSSGNVTLENWANEFDTDNSHSYPYFSFYSSGNYFYSGSESGANTNSIFLWEKKTNTTTTYATSPAEAAPSTVYYTRVESTDALTAGTYLIVCERNNLAFNGALTTLDATGNTVPVTIVSNQIEATSAMDAASFTLAASGSNWTIKSASGYYIGRTSTSNGLESSQDPQYTNSISITSGNATVKPPTIGRNLRYNYATSYDGRRFRYYSVNSQNTAIIQLYKRDTALTNAVLEPVEEQSETDPAEQEVLAPEMKSGLAVMEVDAAKLFAEPEAEKESAEVCTEPDAEPETDAEPEGEAEDQPEPTRGQDSSRPVGKSTETYYVEVTQPVPGEKYLIAYENGNTMYLVGNTIHASSGSRNITPIAYTKSAHGSNGYTLSASGDLSAYLYTVGGSKTEFTLQNASAGYLVFNSSGYPVFNSSATGSYTTWSFAAATGLKNVNWSDDTYYYLGYDANSGDPLFGAVRTSQSYFKLYKPVTVELAAASDTVIYQKVDVPEAGKQYVIVIGSYAVGNAAVSNSRYLNAQAVTFESDTVVVPASAVDSVLWYADGNASDGYTFLNLSANKYLSLNESDSYYLAPMSTGWAWTYDGTDLNNQCKVSGNLNTSNNTYYYYLAARSTASNGFTTTTASGNNIKFYERVVSSVAAHTLTIHYVLAGGGTAAQDYTDVLFEGDPYSVTSPTVGGYTPDQTVVSGTMGSSDVTVTVTYTANVADAWKVHFQTENGGDITGFPDQPIEKTGTQYATDPGDPNVAVHGEDGANDWYFLGWYIPGEDAPYNFTGTPVTGDLTLEARFLYAWKVNYTITLRAVYGMKNTTGDTHIYWYANDGTDVGFGAGAGDRYESMAENEETHQLEAHIPMNSSTPIPVPSGAGTPWTGIKKGNDLFFQGHEFLGWARLETKGAGLTGEGHPELTEADLYLKWDSVNNCYLYNKNGTRAGEPDWTTVVNSVYATEDTPYHDMYAVWRTGKFYVFHSATGKIEALDTDAVRAAGTGTIDLTQRVTPGYLYGGYYLEKTANEEKLSGYGYITPAQMTEIIKGYETGSNISNWATITSPAALDAVATHVVNAESDRVTGFTTYDGSAMYTNGTDKAYAVDAEGKIIKGADGKPIYSPAVWNKNAAATADDGAGTSVIPEAGRVYYLKEVPSYYLSSRVYYTYDTTSDSNEIVDLWVVSLLDDTNYQNAGFKIADGKDADAISSDSLKATKATQICKTFTLVQRPVGGVGNGIKTPVSAETFGLRSGRVSVLHLTDKVNSGKPNFTMLPGWVTFDGIPVYNNGMNWKYVTFTDEQKAADAEWMKKQLTWERVFDGTEKMYIDVSKGQLYGDTSANCWLKANAVIKVMFFDANGVSPNSGYVATRSTGDGNIFEVTIPSGNYTHFLIKRMDPSNPNSTEWNSTGNIPLNEDLGSDQWQGTSAITKNVNLVDYFTGDSGNSDYHVHWGHYPQEPATGTTP